MGDNNKKIYYKKIYEICEEIYKIENFEEFKKLKSGLFITKKSMDILKRNILYFKMKEFVENKNIYPKYEKAEINIKRLFTNENEVNFDKILARNAFNNSEELIKLLNKGEEYYIINKNLYKKIYNIQYLENFQDIKINIEGNKLILIFNDQDKQDNLKFRINKMK